MPLGDHHPVPVLLPGILRIHVQHMAIEHCHQIGHGHGAAHMAQTHNAQSAYGLNADTAGELLQFVNSSIHIHFRPFSFN